MDHVRTTKPVRDTIERLEALGDADPITLGMMLHAFGPTSFVPALMVPSLLVVSPLSGIPLFSTICGLSIALIAMQMLFARRSVWLPEVLLRRHVRRSQLHAALQRMHGLADRLDRVSRDRFRVLVQPPGDRLPKAMCVVSGASMPLLELVPFSSSILGMAVLSCSVAFIARDGLLVFVGAGFMAMASAIPIYVLTSFGG
ncbi:exopolysaccharide biosynthesis protein [Salibaculum sp.]|uniref:exopolysaccharide biosynthesis protein n=1 Tax=Salibaculum sp. TaxID=2855480 RepID=UPI002B496806|nr:exopolysaccharide biosynthesis protein [Salibaculum sp.]HKL70423.1 exopolysaccharide biosynthesis protein [Salibaculum sp.]